MLLRRLYYLLLALMLSATGGHAYAKTYQFNGGKVGGCPLTGNTYTCTSLPLSNWNDNMTIASGYRVDFTSDITFGYDHTLTMSGTAVLSSTGNLDIGGIKTGNLNISGGTLIAGDVFSVGAQNQTLTATIQAVTANLGTGSDLTITGSIKATGTVNVASHATINGPISGATITTNSPVALNGDIVATNSFTLASGSTVKGNITAPVVSLLASGSTVEGNITARTSLQLGSSVTVKTGDVTAGTLTLDSSDALIDGNATIDSGIFNWHGRVTKTIYCSGGTATGKCDCVQNSSGYDVNTTLGPHCQGNAVALDHFLINYNPAGSVCAPSAVTITACANQACTATYGGGATVTLAPTGQSVAIPTSGSVQAAVSWTQAGTFTLGLSGATTASATACNRTDTGTGGDCKVAVASSAYTMTMSADAAYAEAPAPPQLTMAAVRFDAKQNTCVPLFNNVDRNINFTCAYSNPASGTLPVRLNNIPLNSGRNAAAACDGTGATVKLTFNQEGKASVPLQYADAGAVTVKATDSGAGSPPSANVTATFVPAKFALALANANAPYVAGKEFTATVTALNAASTPAATPNFGRERIAESAKLVPVTCEPANGNGLLAQTASPTLAGVQTIKATWSETGRIDLVASLANGAGYLGTGVLPATAATGSATTGCTGGVGTFSPAYFTFDTDADWKRTSRFFGGTLAQYYSGEPALKLKVTARNLQNGVTQNYEGANARDVLFTGVNPDGSALAAGGAFSRSTSYPNTDLVGKAQLRGTDFKAGSATWAGSFTFTKSPTAQTRLRVRAAEDLPLDQYPASSSAMPAEVTAGAEPTLLIRSGRIRLPSRFGPAGTLLRIPLSIEYYTGQMWIMNAEDSTTALPAGIVSTGTAVPGLTLSSTLSSAFGGGKADLTLAPNVAAHVSVPFALNLGTTAANTSCYASRGAGMSTSTGAALAFLRSPDASCAAAGNVDPSALATFGVYAPETKRIIHTREVFR